MNSQTPLQRVRKVSRWVRISCIFLMVLIAVPMFSDLYLLWDEAGYGIKNELNESYSLSREKQAHVRNIPLSEFSLTAKGIYTLGKVIPALFLIKGFYHLNMLFLSYAGGSIFTATANRQIRKFGLSLILMAVLSFPCYQLMANAFSLVLDIPVAILAPFPHLLDIIFPLPIGLLAVCISLIMDAGTEINVDHDLTI